MEGLGLGLGRAAGSAFFIKGKVNLTDLIPYGVNEIVNNLLLISGSHHKIGKYFRTYEKPNIY